MRVRFQIWKEKNKAVKDSIGLINARFACLLRGCLLITVTHSKVSMAGGTGWQSFDVNRGSQFGTGRSRVTRERALAISRFAAKLLAHLHGRREGSRVGRELINRTSTVMLSGERNPARLRQGRGIQL